MLGWQHTAIFLSLPQPTDCRSSHFLSQHHQTLHPWLCWGMAPDALVFLNNRVTFLKKSTWSSSLYWKLFDIHKLTASYGHREAKFPRASRINKPSQGNRQLRCCCPVPQEGPSVSLLILALPPTGALVVAHPGQRTILALKALWSWVNL